MIKKLLAALLVLCMLVLSGCGAKSVAFEKTDGKNTAVVTAVDNDGKTLLSYELSFDDGCTVAEATIFAGKAAGVAIAKTGSGSSIYISSIASLAEFDKGGTSGWLYKVNGEYKSVSCGSVKLKDKDSVEWVYTLDLGKDAGVTVGN